MLPYFGKSALGPAVLLLAACSFDASGLASAGAATTSTGGSSSTGDASSTGGAPTTDPPTTMGPDGTASDSSSSTTTPVDSTTSMTSTGPDLTTTTDTTDPGTTTTDATTDPDTTSTTTDTTTDTGTTTSSTTDTTDASSSTTMPEMCVDPGPEPNGNEGNAVDHGTQHCKAQPQSFSGVLNGNGDADYHRYYGDFSGNGCGDNNPDPTASVTVTASESLRLCVYADCTWPNSQANPNCPNGTMANNSPGGHPGCCRPATVNPAISFVVNCSGTGNESANIFVRLDQAPADSCVEYTVEYSYNN